MNSFFLGFFLILVGLSILINILFGIAIPILRLALGFYLLYAGLSLINGWSFCKYNFFNARKKVRPYGSCSYSACSYQTVFGEGNIDLTSLSYAKKPETVHILTVFGQSIVDIDTAISTKIIASTVFGEVNFPDGSTGHSWHNTYNSHDETPELIVHVTTCFGKTIIRSK